MRKKAIFPVILCFAAGAAAAQPAPRAAGVRPQGPPSREDALDPTPVDPAKDPDIGLFLNDWHGAKPRVEYGKLTFHDILTRLDSADPVHPKKRGAVLTEITAVSYATLAPGAVASGRAKAGERQVFYAVGGAGNLTVNGKSFGVKDGVGFTLTPDFDFKLASTGKAPLAFYVRTEPLPPGAKSSPDVVVVNRFDLDRRIGAHWVHTCNGGPSGMTLCTIPPHAMPQPHSHPGEEAWIMVKGESILSLGKNLVRMHPGQAYKIPPTGVTAHSNLNMSDEPVEMIYMGPADRSVDAAQVAARAQTTGPANLAAMDYARLDNSPINRAAEPDIDMFMGNWRDAFPRMEHGNLYMRDMLTALQGPDPLHPTRKGAVLTNAQAVSYALLEPGSSAHPLDGELKGAQETFVVNSGTGVIVSAGKTVPLSKGMAFILTPGLDYKLTATGDRYMSSYVVTESLPDGFTPKAGLTVIDDRSKPETTEAWFDQERPLITKGDGLAQYGALTAVRLKPMAMARPYSDAQGVEEIWIATDGDVDLLLGKQLRKLPAGTAYRVPSTGITAHANFNLTDKPANFISIVKQ